jgi:hypothetical protein
MILLAIQYVRWHYTYAVADLVGIMLNFVWFLYEFFSIPILLKTLFVPFHRLSESKHTGFDPAAWLQALTINTLMRIVGALMRLLLIAIGIVLIMLVAVVGLGFLIVWLLAPLFVIFLVGSGLTFLAIG